MFCYVGKATKIFFFVISFVVVAGLIIGFGALRHHGKGGADSNKGPTIVPDQPIPATATAAPPLQSPPTPVSTALGPIAS